MTTTEPSITTQVLAWVNSLTLPTIVAGSIAISRWVTKKEEEAKAVVAVALQKMDTIRDNHLHHIQGTLNDIKAGQDKHHEAEERHQGELVQAIQSSQTAIVQAIITSKK